MSRKVNALRVMLGVPLLVGLGMSIATTQSVLAEQGGCSGSYCSGSCGAGGNTNCCSEGTGKCECYALTSPGC